MSHSHYIPPISHSIPQYVATWWTFDDILRAAAQRPDILFAAHGEEVHAKEPQGSRDPNPVLVSPDNHQFVVFNNGLINGLV